MRLITDRDGKEVAFLFDSTSLRPEMFELAIHSKHQHLQAVLAARGVVLRLVGDKWQSIQPPSNGLAGPWIEFIPKSDGVLVRTSKDLTLRLPDQASEKSVLPLPLNFAINQSEFELVNAKAIRASQSQIKALEANGDGNTENGLSEATLSRWFEALSTLNHWKVDSVEFLQAATELVVEPLGFDAAYLVALNETKEEPEWQVVASHLPCPELGVWFDTSPLNQLLEKPNVYYQPASENPGSENAVEGVSESSIAFAPRFRKDGSIMGAIVGVRHLHSKNARSGVRPLEAKLLHLLADSINQEQARAEQQEYCARRRKLLEQAFMPALATRIEQDPQVLDGCRREVSVLFADLRDSSGLFQSENAANSHSRLTPVQTYQVLSDVMDTLTAAVIHHEGLVIDYYGDGLAAMWNAPFDQPNHVVDACEAAIEMQEKLHVVSQRWRNLLGRNLSLGIGIHTGAAQVGNIGSQWKLKYGARGVAVNLASRLEQTTKQLGTAIVLSGEVARSLPQGFPIDRLCRALVAGIDEGIDLYRLGTANECFDTTAYAEVLSLFEAGLYELALETILDSQMQSGPMAFMAEQITAAIESRPGRRRRDTNSRRETNVDPRDRVISFA